MIIYVQCCILLPMKAYDFNVSKIVGGAYLLDGTDTYWRDYVIKSFGSLVPKDYKVFNIKQIDKIDSPETLRDAVITFSMFDAPTVVMCFDDKFDDGNKKNDSYEKIIRDIDAQTYLLFVYYSKVSASFKKLCTVIECVKPSIDVVKSIAKKSLGVVEIDPRAMDLLIQYSNMDLSRIILEIEKLKCYTSGKKINKEDVEINVSNNIEDAVFELSEAVSSKNYARAKELVDRLSERGYGYSALLAIITNHYRRMFHSVLSNLSDFELSEILGVKEYAVKKARMAGGKYTKVRLKEIIDMLVDTEFSFKSGQMTDETAFKTAFYRLIAQ